ncbi:hypothetical protein ED733_000807 [Metarhizium rileyi]|uniref:gamma-glutamylcyclotransferase n=1 Tax=Metarhizium rileyi (strain RCEF 4871) TaxID=1649241 RepID=A0A5C6G5A5_METRR|nr:hypothetical protein ED733_000807 [Metarhizium rileyi]
MSPTYNVGSAAPAALEKAEISARQPARGSYPPTSSISTTALERLAKAAEDAHPSSNLAAADTVLYLAYGSNMCAKTFLGVRGIRPLSQVNVAVPSLRLTFDLAGVPYREPCFANVGFRNVPDKKKDCQAKSVHQDMDWDGGLVGVVYEVTQKDYRTIMRTEGAGSSYEEIVVSCHPIVQEDAFHTAPKPFLARTLYAADTSNGDDKRRWWQRLLDGRQRPDPNYAQASLRYLDLLRDGGREHGLPTSYQNYLRSLHPYIATKWSQIVGQYLFLSIWAPLLVFFFIMTGFLADETGRLPPWLAKGVTLMFNIMWTTYDAIFKPVFGDGERTVEDDADERKWLLGIGKE